MNDSTNKVIPNQPYLRPVESQKYITFNPDKAYPTFANQPTFTNQPQPNNTSTKNVMSDRVK